MKYLFKYGVFFILACILNGLALAADTVPDETIQFRQDAQRIINSFQMRLGKALKGAMSKQGPVGAIEVCAQKAPQIAQEISAQNNVLVYRISDKNRNAANAPSKNDRKALKKLKKARKKGAEDLTLLKQDKHGTRYYQGITIQPLCLTCHGENLSNEVKEALNTLYPKDKATGYQLGDFRGAFVVEW